MTHLGYLGIAFALVWVGFAFYLVSISRRQAKLESQIDKLSSRNAESSKGLDG